MNALQPALDGPIDKFDGMMQCKSSRTVYMTFRRQNLLADLETDPVVLLSIYEDKCHNVGKSLERDALVSVTSQYR